MFEVPQNLEHLGHNVRLSFLSRVEIVIYLPRILLSFKQDWYPLYFCSRHQLGKTVCTQLIQVCIIFLLTFLVFCST